MGVEIIEDDMDGRVRVSRDDLVHEVEKLDAPPALFVDGRHLAGCHLEGGKQRRRAVAIILVTVAGQRPPVGEFQVTLRLLQSLDRRLFIDADDNCVLRRRSRPLS